MWLVLCPRLQPDEYLDRINGLTQEQLLDLDLDTVENVLAAHGLDSVRVDEEATYANGALKAPDQVRNALVASVHALDGLTDSEDIDVLWVVGQPWYVMAPHGDDIPAGYDEFILLSSAITTAEETAIFSKRRADGILWLEVLNR